MKDEGEQSGWQEGPKEEINEKKTRMDKSARPLGTTLCKSDCAYWIKCGQLHRVGDV